MTHVACESNLRPVSRPSMHPCPENWVATGRAVEYFAWAARAFSAGIKCWHCIIIIGVICFISFFSHPSPSRRVCPQGARVDMCARPALVICVTHAQKTHQATGATGAMGATGGNAITYKPLKLKRFTVEIVVWYADTFDSNLVIMNYFTKYLKESCW